MNVLFLQSGSNLAPKMQANAKVKHDRQSSNLNSDSHGSLVNQLCRLVDTIRQSNVNGQRSETTSAAITRLFPSVNRTRSSSHNTIRHNLYQAGQTSPN